MTTALASSEPAAGRQLLELYRQMVLIREFEVEAERQYKLAQIGGYCHLSIGQEASCVGSVAAMTEDDLLVTGYRSHGFALARGLSPNAVMAELFGREDGCAGGRGGSMHLLEPAVGYYGGWGIVGGQLPIAAGLALALNRQQIGGAVLCEFGDGAANIGAFHEALNLASLWGLPVLFLLINNIYGMGTSVERASAEPELFRRGASYRIESERIDGDDVSEVQAATCRLLHRARVERKPALLEVMTYRYRGHSVADAGLNYRRKSEVEGRRQRDPLLRVRDELVTRGLDEAVLDGARKTARAQVVAAVEFASESAEPPLAQLACGSYAPGSHAQFDRMRPGSPYGEVELVFEAGLGGGNAF